MTTLIVSDVSRALLAAVLVAAAGSKLGSLNDFTLTLHRLFPTLGLIWAKRLAAATSLIELGEGLGLASGALMLVFGLLAVGLTTVFVSVTLLASRRLSEVTCRCFGSLTESRFDRRSVIRSLLLLVLAIVTVLGGLGRPLFDISAPWALLVFAGYMALATASSQASQAIAEWKGEAST